VVVAEVMQRALIKEPQVAVTVNAVKHLHAGGVLVPERVELQPCLLDPSKEFSIAEDASQEPPPAVRRRINLGPPFVLSAESAKGSDVTRSGTIRLPDVHLPAQIAPGYELKILTKIVTFGDIVIQDYESGLTFPHPPMGDFETAPGTKFELRYRLGEEPGLVGATALALEGGSARETDRTAAPPGEV